MVAGRVSTNVCIVNWLWHSGIFAIAVIDKKSLLKKNFFGERKGIHFGGKAVYGILKNDWNDQSVQH